MAPDDQEQKHTVLNSTFPVLLPFHSALTFSRPDFDEFLKKNVRPAKSIKWSMPDAVDTQGKEKEQEVQVDEDALVSTASSTTAEITKDLKSFDVDDTKRDVPQTTSEQPFMKGLLAHDEVEPANLENKMLTENADVAFRSTNSALVDLFYELEKVISGPRLRELLNAAWSADPLATLKIIFNARSIHLGKSEKPAFYRCCGWLAREHPRTLLMNLQWLSRPVIEKKIQKTEVDEDDLVLVEPDKDEDDPTRFDVKDGVAHGYWKDLLNLLALSVDDKADVLADPQGLLKIKLKCKKKDRVWDATQAKQIRHKTYEDYHKEAVRKFEGDAFHQALHVTVARLFAEQLASDLKLLQSKDPKALRKISLCAKWSPSHKLFHDKHTFIVSSIAEILHPQSQFKEVQDRETYLRHAREAYRKDVASLRKALGVVERDISATAFQNIKYDRVPSLAMNRYSTLFAEKDTKRFENYVEKVALGKKKISGATLLPSTLISLARTPPPMSFGTAKNKKAMVEQKTREIDAKIVDGQWKTLVQRIKDSGTLESSIAVCDTSGSMCHPIFPDKTCPLDSSIGLSLLVAEVTKAPFGGAFISFSESPAVQVIDLNSTLREKVARIQAAPWGMSTNFVKVFEDLILPMARKNKLKQEDMVKQIFVFSDMQFNQATQSQDRWSTSFERIQKQYSLYGYEMPRLIFWNLAGGRGGYTGSGDPVAPKPVTVDETGTALVSGYSQGLLKVFLDGGSFEDEEAEEEIVEEIEEKTAEDGTQEKSKRMSMEIEEDDEAVMIQKRKKTKMDPLIIVKKAISHKAYSMLDVFD